MQVQIIKIFFTCGFMLLCIVFGFNSKPYFCFFLFIKEFTYLMYDFIFYFERSYASVNFLLIVSESKMEIKNLLYT